MLKNEKEVQLNSEKINKRERKIKALKLGLLISALFLIIIYAILRVVYAGGAFTISLDPDFAKKKGIIIYENPEEKNARRILSAEKNEFVDNISIKWLPDDLNKHPGGPHNGDNYVAYTFYIENQGSETVNYWYTILVDDVIKNVDNAVRVMVYLNDDRTVYAKPARNGGAENGTVPFVSNDTVMIAQRANFDEGMIDKITVVIFLEGDDPECLDDIIGGEMKMHMEIAEERLGKEGQNRNQNEEQNVLTRNETLQQNDQNITTND